MIPFLLHELMESSQQPKFTWLVKKLMIRELGKVSGITQLYVGESLNQMLSPLRTASNLA